MQWLRALALRFAHPAVIDGRNSKKSGGRIAAALLFLYLAWGSSYLGNHLAIRSIPPFVLVSLRYMTAGLVLYLLSRWQGAESPSLRNWLRGALLGVLMIGFTQGAIIEAQKQLPSGLVALILATLPLWAVLLHWGVPPRRPPSGPTLVGLLLGLTGISLLLLQDVAALHLAPMLLVCLAALSWACGLVLAPHLRFTPSLLQASAMQMLIGGAAVLLYGLVTAQWHLVPLASIHPESWLAFGYLILFPSILAYPVYNWLLNHTDPSQVASFAFVNPIVAMALGWMVLGEQLTPLLLLCALLMLMGVVLLTRAPRVP